MYKYDFEINFFKKIICWERLQARSSDLEHIFSIKKYIYIDYSSSLPYLIDINWLTGFIFRVK